MTNQHRAYHHPSPGAHLSRVPGLSVWEACAGHPHRHELLRWGSQRGDHSSVSHALYNPEYQPCVWCRRCWKLAGSTRCVSVFVYRHSWAFCYVPKTACNYPRLDVLQSLNIECLGQAFFFFTRYTNLSDWIWLWKNHININYRAFIWSISEIWTLDQTDTTLFIPRQQKGSLAQGKV